MYHTRRKNLTLLYIFFADQWIVFAAELAIKTCVGTIHVLDI